MSDDQPAFPRCKGCRESKLGSLRQTWPDVPGYDKTDYCSVCWTDIVEARQSEVPVLNSRRYYTWRNERKPQTGETYGRRNR